MGRRSKELHGDFVVWLATAMRGVGADGYPTMNEPPATYVELGLHKGRTFNRVAPLVKRAVGVDCALSKKVARAENAELYEMTTRDFAKIWHEPIDLLFIDADHHYDSVKFDFDTFAPFVRPHLGVIVMHDTYVCKGSYAKHYPELHTTWCIADEIHRRPEYAEYEIVTLPVQRCGLSIVRRAPTHLDWNP